MNPGPMLKILYTELCLVSKRVPILVYIMRIQRHASKADNEDALIDGLLKVRVHNHFLATLD